MPPLVVPFHFKFCDSVNTRYGLPTIVDSNSWYPPKPNCFLCSYESSMHVHRDMNPIIFKHRGNRVGSGDFAGTARNTVESNVSEAKKEQRNAFFTMS